MKTTKQYFWQRDFQHRFQRVNELGSHRPIWSDAALKISVSAMQYNATNNEIVAFIACNYVDELM